MLSASVLRAQTEILDLAFASSQEHEKVDLLKLAGLCACVILFCFVLLRETIERLNKFSFA